MLLDAKIQDFERSRGAHALTKTTPVQIATPAPADHTHKKNYSNDDERRFNLRHPHHGEHTHKTDSNNDDGSNYMEPAATRRIRSKTASSVSGLTRQDPLMRRTASKLSNRTKYQAKLESGQTQAIWISPPPRFLREANAITSFHLLLAVSSRS